VIVWEVGLGWAACALVVGLLVGYGLGHASGKGGMWQRLVWRHGTAEAYRLLGDLSDWPPPPPLRKGSGERPTTPRPKFPARRLH
jgi:hypothetical protein